MSARLGELRVREVRTVHVSRMLRAIAAEHDLVKNTLQHIKSVLSGIFTYAKNEGAFDGANPVRGALLSIKTRSKRNIQSAEDGEPKFRSGNSRVGNDSGRVPVEHAQSTVGCDFSIRKAFDPAVLAAMQRMQASLEQLRSGQQLASSLLPFNGKLLKSDRGEVAERLNAAVC